MLSDRAPEGVVYNGKTNDGWMLVDFRELMDVPAKSGRCKRQRSVSLAEIPAAEQKNVTVSYSMGSYTMPGLGTGLQSGPIDMGYVFPDEVAARSYSRKLMKYGNARWIIVSTETMREWERQRYIARAKAKARKIK